jgi:hypothetical protein
LFANGKERRSAEKGRLVFLLRSTEDIVSYPTANYAGITFSREGLEVALSSASTSPDIVAIVSDNMSNKISHVIYDCIYRRPQPLDDGI